MNNKERLELAAWAQKIAKSQGATETAISISRSRSVSVEVREQKVETIRESTENSLFLQIYSNNKYSGHSTNNLNTSQLERFIREAVDATQYLSKDPDRNLPDPELYPRDMSLNLNLHDASHARLSPEERVEMAMKTEALLRAGYSNILSATGSFNDSNSEQIRLHSNGFSGQTESTYFGISGSVTIMDEGARPAGSAFAGVRHLDRLPQPQEIAESALHDVLRQRGQSSMASGRYSMIIDNRIAGNLLWRLFQPMNARNIQQQNSFLIDMLDKPIASDKLTIVDNPLIPGALGSRLYDNEGIAARERVMIENGVLKAYFIDNYYGKKLGMTPNGGSTSNVLLGLGTKSQEQLIAETPNGIFVTSFNGGNANSTTGDFSFGISGQLVENGKVVRAVNEMNISGNFKSLWHQLVETGNDPYAYSSMQCPTLVFRDVDFSGL